MLKRSWISKRAPNYTKKVIFATKNASINIKILIIQQKMIGDVLTSTIIFEAIKEKYRFYTYGDAMLII